MSYGISTDLITNLTAEGKTGTTTKDYVWYDISNSVVVDVSLNERILFATSAGAKTLSNDSGSLWSDACAFNLVDELFVDADGDKFYTSYVDNYQSSTATSDMYDISLSDLGSVRTVSAGTTIDVTSRKDNSVTFDLAAYAGSSGNKLSAYEMHMSTHLDFLPAANVTDVSSNLAVNVYEYGLDIDVNHEYNLGQSAPKLSFYANSLSANSVVRFEPDAAQNASEFTSYPKPSIALSNVISGSTLIGAGRSLVTMDVTLPTVSSGFKSGAWNWLVHIEDATTGYKSAVVPMRIAIYPRFTQPKVILDSALTFATDVSQNIGVAVQYVASDTTNVDILAWGAHLDASADIVKMVSGSWVSSSDAYLTVTTGWEDLSSNLAIDASANFVVKHISNKYGMTGDSYGLRITYNDTISDRSFVKPITITGRTHTSKVAVTNKYDGTYTVASGNRGTGEHYMSRTSTASSGDSWSTWSRLHNTNASYNIKSVIATASNVVRMQFAVSDEPFVGSPRVFNASVSTAVVMNTFRQGRIDISSGALFTDVANSNVVSLDADGNVINADKVISGSILTLTDTTSDIFINVERPAWLSSLSDIVIVATLSETVGSGNAAGIVGMDLSGNDFLRSALKVSGQNKFGASMDPSHNLITDLYTMDTPLKIDIKLAPERLTSSDALLTVEFKFAGATRHTMCSRYYIKSTVPANSGDRKNNLIMPNRSKINFSKAINGTITKVNLTDISNSEVDLMDISTNTYRNLGLAESGMLNLNLPRSEFMGASGHGFDISGFSIIASNGNGIVPKLYLPFSVYGDTQTSGAPLNLEEFGDVSANFSNYGDIFLDTGYYTGVLDIKYSTVYRNEHSDVLNTVRVFVLPRPNIDLTVRDPSENVHRVDAPTWLSETGRNVQKNGNSEITFAGTGNTIGYTEASRTSIATLLAHYTKISFVSKTYSDITDPDSGLEGRFGISDEFIALDYGSNGSALVSFAGADLDYNSADVSGNKHILHFNSEVVFKRHALFTANNLVSDNENFKVYVINDFDEMLTAATIVANDIHMSNTLSINNVDFLRYVTTGVDIDLTSDERFSTAVFLVIENTDHYDISIDRGSGSDIIIKFAERHLFGRTAAGIWSDYGLI
jgi:hypothetical protein